MRIHKTLEEAKNDLIRVGDIIDYCNKQIETLQIMEKASFDKVGYGLSEGELYGFIAYAHQQQEIYGFDIPNVIRCIINEPLQTEENLCSCEIVTENA